MFGAIGQLASLAKSNTAGFADTSAELADVPKDNYDFGLQRWMKKRGKFYRPNLSASEVKEYKDAFRIIDLDGSGTLEVDELVQAMRALDQPVSAYEMTKLVELIAPGKGFLNETDFIELVHYRSLPNGAKKEKKTSEEASKDDTNQPKKVQVSMGILAGTFRRKKALDLLMLPWEIRNNTMQEAERQSELSQILAPQAPLEPAGHQKTIHKSPKALKTHGTATSMNSLDTEGRPIPDHADYTEHLFSMPLLPSGLSKKLRNDAIRETIPTSYSATLMSRIEEKIQAEVALETTETSKTAFYLPPVHKRKQIPYVENVDSMNLSPKIRHQSSSGLTQKEELERYKQCTLKKYSFPSNIPLLKSPKEMQEPYAFLAQQLIVSNQNSKHAKLRAKKKPAKERVVVNVSQVMKEAESLLQTAKLALRQSRRQAQDSVVITPSCDLEHGRRSASPSTLNSSPMCNTFDLKSTNQLNNSPVGPVLNSVQKSASTLMSFTPDKNVTINTGPIIRIFKAELAPVVSNRIKIQINRPDAKEANSAKQDSRLNVDPTNEEIHEGENAPKMKSFMEMEKTNVRASNNAIH